MGKIDKDKYYTLGEIVRGGFVERIDTIPKAARLMNNYELRKILNPKIMRRGARGVQYQIKGKNILDYLEQAKDDQF